MAKKNGQYVGVDEKYIPEDEKYVDNDLNSEIKEDIHNIYKGAKEYVSDKDNQEKMKNVGKKGIKIAKGVGIGYLIFYGFIILLVIFVFVFTFAQIFRINKIGGNLINNIIDEGMSEKEKNDDEWEKNEFNREMESYMGTKYGSDISRLFDSVVTKMKKNSKYKITIIYNDTTTSDTTEITALKQKFADTKKYEVSMDYDSEGYVNKITITDIDDSDDFNELSSAIFNIKIETYSGTEYGSSVTSLLDEIIKINKKYPNHIITVTYSDTTTTNTDEITTLKKEFKTMSQYEVSMDYDSNGYINKITITNY